MPSIKEAIRESGVLAHVVLPPAMDFLLDGLVVDGSLVPAADDDAQILLGKVKLDNGVSKSPLPGFDFGLALPTNVVEAIPCKLRFFPKVAPTSFEFWLVLREQGQTRVVFELVDRIPGFALRGATLATDPVTGKSLITNGQKPRIVSKSAEAGTTLGPALCIAAAAGEIAALRFTPDTNSALGDLIAFGFDQEFVTFGDSHIGFHLDDFVIDSSTTRAADGHGPTGFAADLPAWTGLVARKLDFYLPGSVPFIGGEPISGYFALPDGPGSPQLVVEARLPERQAAPGVSWRPALDVRIECMDPTATGLSGLVPTLIKVDAVLSSSDLTASVDQQPISFISGKPLGFTATFSRDPLNSPGEMKMALAMSGRGDDGLITVRSGAGEAAHWFNIGALGATSLLADEWATTLPNGNVLLPVLVSAGAALSKLFNRNNSQFTLHGIEIESTGSGLPVGKRVRLILDYSVSAAITKLDFAGFGVGMNPDQPLRVRVRGAELSINPGEPDLAMIELDYEHAELEIENPGGWDIGPLANLFDVLGSRSGRGSTWIEVDLRFKLNLGPVQVSSMTLRATIDRGGSMSLSIQGLGVSLNVPGVAEGEGQLQLASSGGFSAYVRASIVPLQVIADARVFYSDDMIVLILSIDLPAPLPLANSGLGLFGVAGVFGINAQPSYAANAESDPVLRQLQWKPRDQNAFRPLPDQMTMGFEAAIGTLPDFGFMFSAKASILVSVPEVSIRGSLNGLVIQPRMQMKDEAYPPPPGLSFLGFIAIDGDAVTFAVTGSAKLEPLLKVTVPISGHYPFEDADNWYTYLGADGHPAPDQGRSMGPIAAEVLPDLLGIRADAYLMARGRGILEWPYRRPPPGGPITIVDGVVVAFGFSFEARFGASPIAWAELNASLDVLAGAKPLTLSGFGSASGSLNLGPFSLGVSAAVSFISQDDNTYLWVSVTARIELFFFDIEGTVTITFGDDDKPTLPPPETHPLDLAEPRGTGGPLRSTPVLFDDSYRILAPLSETPDVPDEQCVWPDAMISIPFAIAPLIGDDASDQFAVDVGPPQPATTGTEMLSYEWTLKTLNLFDVTGEADKTAGGTKVKGRLAARWQAPRGSSPGNISELVLFSLGGDHWLSRRLDGGRKLPGDPLKTSVNQCSDRVSAHPGWAIGSKASLREGGYRLPPDPISLDRLVSRVDLDMTHVIVGLGEGGMWAEDSAIYCRNDPNMHRSAARIDRFESPVSHQLPDWPDGTPGASRDFNGYFLPPFVEASTRYLSATLLRQQLVLRPVTPIQLASIVLIAAREVFDEAPPLVQAQGMTFDLIDRREIDEDGLTLATYRLLLPRDILLPFADGQIDEITVSYGINDSVGLVGVHALTAVAVAEATQRNIAGDKLTVLIRDAASLPLVPIVATDEHEPTRRAILKPGRLYRLDVDFTWSGKLFLQDKNGARIDGDAVADQTVYKRNGVSTTTKRQLFFRTAPKPLASVRPAKFDPGTSKWIHERQDLFDPNMLERYFGGYEPAQSEKYRFPIDPIRAHFTQNHVAALAKSYGFDLKIAVRRLDVKGGASAFPAILPIEWLMGAAPRFLSPADRFRLEAIEASNCMQPLPGAVARVRHDLATNATYEAYVKAQPSSSAELVARDGRLKGVTFTTSRWRTPQEMYAALGFAVDGTDEGHAIHGDLQIDRSLTGRKDRDDSAFDTALDELGLHDWPMTDRPRLSRLWTKGDDWTFAGLMLESPEPILRKGRLELKTGSPTLDMGMSFSTLLSPFDVRRSDAGCFRMLLLTARPAPLSMASGGLFGAGHDLSDVRLVPPRFSIAINDVEAGTTINLSRTLPIGPSFEGAP